MAQHLERLANRLEEDTFFLACPLRLYADSEQLDEEQLAASLGCSRQTLVMLRLCRAPDMEAGAFKSDIERIASRFGIAPLVLAEAVRRGQALFHLRKSTGQQGTLMAARDAEKETDPE